MADFTIPSIWRREGQFRLLEDILSFSSIERARNRRDPAPARHF